ncbi:MAG TPA: GntR family transcriptional regulator, partial [Solirubrobacteraceae bacterium]
MKREEGLSIRLDRDSELPLGVQLAWHLRSAVAAGELRSGARLPSVRELAATTGVNANTVRAVYARLEAEGLVATEHGRGTFVTGEPGGDGELAAIAQRAAREARAAGLDPRAVAAALFVTGEAPLPARPDAARRRALRTEIAALERRLGD